MLKAQNANCYDARLPARLRRRLKRVLLQRLKRIVLSRGVARDLTRAIARIGTTRMPRAPILQGYDSRLDAPLNARISCAGVRSCLTDNPAVSSARGRSPWPAPSLSNTPRIVSPRLWDAAPAAIFTFANPRAQPAARRRERRTWNYNSQK